MWTERKFQTNFSSIAGLTWLKTLKIIMISTTFSKRFLENIKIERDINYQLIKTGVYINAANKIPMKILGYTYNSHLEKKKLRKGFIN